MTMYHDDDSLRSDSSSEAASPELLPPYLLSLSTSQLIAFEKLKSLCSQQKVNWHEQGKGSRTVPGNDDVTLLRYLRARDYNPTAAFKQYSATVSWRRKERLDELYASAEVSHFEAISRLFPQWTGRRSRRGVPLFAYRIPKVRTEDLLSTTKADPRLSSVFLPAEYCSQLVQPLCARMHPDGAAPCLMHIIDLSGVSVRHFWNLRSHLQKLSTMATAHYPEAVDRIFILGAPSFFPTIWGYINKWFEPNLTSKISVLAAADAYATLVQHIDPENIPIFAGGNLDWDYGMHPNLDEETTHLVGEQLAKKWIEGPLKVVSDEKGDHLVLAGSVGKSAREGLVVTLAGGRRDVVDSEEEEIM